MKNIAIKELVCNHIYTKFGDSSERFLDPKLLETLDVIRNKILNIPLVINNRTTITQRGLRCNCCNIVVGKTKKNIPYLSGHCLGKAVDFSSGSMSANDMRKKIIENKDLLPYKIRMESEKDAPTWVHIDIMVSKDQEDKIYVFRA